MPGARRSRRASQDAMALQNGATRGHLVYPMGRPFPPIRMDFGWLRGVEILLFCKSIEIIFEIKQKQMEGRDDRKFCAD